MTGDERGAKEIGEEWRRAEESGGDGGGGVQESGGE